MSKVRKKKRPSGPSGGHLIPHRSVRVPDDLWARFAAACEAAGQTRNAVLLQLIEEYCR